MKTHKKILFLRYYKPLKCADSNEAYDINKIVKD